MKKDLDTQEMQAVSGGESSPLFTKFLKPHKPSDVMTTMAVGEEDDNWRSIPFVPPRSPRPIRPRPILSLQDALKK